MKAEILQLQPYDNIDSVLDKLGQIYNASRGLTQIQIVWPKRGRVLEDSLDYARIAGWAERHGLQAVLVTTDPAVIRIAEEHQLPFYSSLESIPTNATLRPNRYPLKRSYSQRVLKLAKLRSEHEKLQRPPASWKKNLPLFLFGLAGFLLALYCILPHATIQLQPVMRTRELKLPLWTSNQLNALTMNGGVPSENMTFTISRSATVPATGSIESAGSLATVLVVLKNTCDRTQKIPAGTHLSAAADQPWLFHTLEAIDLAVAGQRATLVEADAAGEKYNLPANTLTAMQIPFDQCIQISQSEAATGGTDGSYRSPCEADYQTALEQIHADVLADADNIIAEHASLLNYVLPGSFTIGEVLSETLDPPFGYAGDTFSLEQQMEVSFRMVSRRNIYNQVKLAFDLFPEEGFVPENNLYDFQIVPDSCSFENDQYHFSVIGMQNGLSGLDVKAISQAVRGLPLGDAVRQIESTYSADSKPQIEIWPPGFTRLPIVASNIKVTLP
jgi:hypothetical protein